jgi:transcriptional regulator with XRE-family HTH domain
MEIYEKLKFIRLFKDLSQEEMAKKLHMHTKSYAKIERGEVGINLNRLKQISKVLGVELKELMGLNEKNVINFIENFYSSIHQQSNNGIVEQKDCTHELEKAYLIIEQKDKIIEHKDKEITYLQEIIELLKKESAS